MNGLPSNISDFVFSWLRAEGYKNVSLDSTLMGTLGMDSLDLLDFVLAIEMHTGLMFPDEKLGETSTVRDVISFFHP